LASNAQFNIAVLDPDTFKQNLITYLSSLPQYSGYNFAGANWNVVLDVLARNTFLRSFYTNMAFSETFLDSAQLINNVISRAKELGYVAGSMTSATTTLDLVVNTNSLASFSIPAGTRFLSRSTQNNFVFITTDSFIQKAVDGNYTFNNVPVFEGSLTSDVFVVDNSIVNQTFVMSNQSVDISSLIVSVTQNGTNTITYQSANNLYNLNGNSTVYFPQATSNSKYEIIFGDGIFGYQPISGSIVDITYRVCSGSDGNGCNTFSLLDNLGGINGGIIDTIAITANTPSFDGSNNEVIDSIRYNAPRSFQTQGRAVTFSDYRNLILRTFPRVGDCHVYGGGITANDISFGTVMVAAVSSTATPLTNLLKTDIQNFLAPLQVGIIGTQMVDPNFLFIDISSNVSVDFSTTANTSLYYNTQAINAIATFSNTNLQKFNKVFRFSKLEGAIDKIDKTSILGNETSIIIKRSFPTAISNATNVLAISFSNPITNVSSDQFISNGITSFISDTINNASNGNLFQINVNANNNVINFNTIGAVNYSNGLVTINNLLISSGSNNTPVYIYAAPLNTDIYSSQNDILIIDPLSIDVNIISANST
jgi:hypothetical protein